MDWVIMAFTQGARRRRSDQWHSTAVSAALARRRAQHLARAGRAISCPQRTSQAPRVCSANLNRARLSRHP